MPVHACSGLMPLLKPFHAQCHGKFELVQFTLLILSDMSTRGAKLERMLCMRCHILVASIVEAWVEAES